MEQKLIQLAIEYGSDAAWLLPVFSYPEWVAMREKGLLPPQTDYIRPDAETELPGANALLLLLKRYEALEDGYVSGYYLASQQCYEAARALTFRLRADGVPAAVARVPLKETVLKAGLGVKLKNGLTAIAPYGTRFALEALFLTLERAPVLNTAIPPGKETACRHCGRCETACPTGAVDTAGFRWQKCLRAYMENEPMPQWVMERITVLLGCERCQAACPVNAGQKTRRMTEAERAAFAPERLLCGEQKEALALIGKNQKKNGKLMAQAACAAANNGRKDLLPLLEALEKTELTPIQKTAVNYALSVLKN